MFEIVIDSSANLTEDLIKKYRLHVASLSCSIDGHEILTYQKGEKFDFEFFYAKLREKGKVTTSLANTDTFERIMTPLLEQGRDVFYIGMLGKISGTFAAGAAAVEKLKKKFPDRRIMASDSLSASLGQGLLSCRAAELRDGGASLEEVFDWLEKNKVRMRHVFTADDLFYLKRSGRVSGVKAFIGSIISMKPILQIHKDGTPVISHKVKGRRKSIMFLAEQAEKFGIDLKNQTVGIVHGDCLDDALELKRLIEDKVGAVLLDFCDSVIGTHVGPGALALFFMGAERD